VQLAEAKVAAGAERVRAELRGEGQPAQRIFSQSGAAGNWLRQLRCSKRPKSSSVLGIEAPPVSLRLRRPCGVPGTSCRVAGARNLSRDPEVRQDEIALTTRKITSGGIPGGVARRDTKDACGTMPRDAWSLRRYAIDWGLSW
ncbi:MAG: hypothetical protein ACE5MG_12950, partial [Candidatus Methylomirabilales bacterium]